MFLLERSIQKTHWTYAYKMITRLCQRGHARHLKNDVIEVHDPRSKHTRFYAVMNERKSRPIGWLWSRRTPGWKAWDESHVWIFPEFRGQGLSNILYSAAINEDGLILHSGRSHTHVTKALWEKFVRKGTFSIWAQDLKNLRVRSDVFWEKDSNELWCALDLYNDAPNQDVRLIATRNKS